MSSVPVILVFLSKMLQLHKDGRPSLEPDTGGLSRADKQVRHKGSGAGSGALRTPSAPVGREAPAARSRHDGLGRRSPREGGARPLRAPWGRVGTGSRSMGPCAGREPCEAREPLPGAVWGRRVPAGRARLPLPGPGGGGDGEGDDPGVRAGEAAGQAAAGGGRLGAVPRGCAGDAGESQGLAGDPRSPLRCGRRSGAHPLQEARATGGGGEAGTRVGVRREASAVRSLKFIKSLSRVV